MMSMPFETPPDGRTERFEALVAAHRREFPPPAPEPPFAIPEPSRHGDVTWLQPYSGAEVERRETIELAFIAALQRLPPRQTAAVVLCDVLDFSTAEAATMLDVTPTAVKGLLQRARAALGPSAEPPSPDERDLARRFGEAFAGDDIAAVVALLTDDAWLTMPPAPHEYHGPEAIAAFLRASAASRAGRRFVLEPTSANGQPAFACTLDGRPAGLVVLATRAELVSAITRFLPGPPRPTSS
jgi:hypothetical protein